MYKFLLPLFALALLVGCTPSTPNTQSNNPYANQSASSAPADTQQMLPATSSAAPSMPTAYNGPLLTGKHTVVLHTNKGDITVEMDADKAPKTVTNFVVLSQRGYFNGLTFHRVIPEFMIQGGDPSGNGTGGESIFGPEFEDEPNDLLMDEGVIAMANRGPNTNGSQFFIVTADGGTPWLQGRHTVFGKVTAGMDIAQAISNAQRDPNDKPVQAITFTPEVKN